LGTGLRAALGLKPGEIVAFVGAGGKTTTAWLLLCELADMGEKAVFTTTTRVFKPRFRAPTRSHLTPSPYAGHHVHGPVLVVAPDPTPAMMGRALGDSSAVVLAAALGERGEPAHAALSPYPAEPVKLLGLAPQVLNGLAEQVPDVTWLVEADGAKGRLLKAPADHEPAIPSEADRVVVVAGLDALGEPLNERTVHRPEIAARLLSVHLGATITPALVADLISHGSGGLKDIPPRAEAAVLLAQRDDRSREADAEIIARQLLSGDRIARVVWAALHLPDPVVALWLDASPSR
jgi:probable selenium-dependent hydroxylase accessory protein YqeC